MALFQGRRDQQDNDRIPPGQYLERGFPVLSYGPTPQINTNDWRLTIDGLVDNEITLTWDEFLALPMKEMKTDIHCVTRWSKLDTLWQGVSLDELFAKAGVKPEATHILASSYGGYTTNLPLEDVMNNRAMVAHIFDSKPLAAEHGGPARLFVPHLYFWKSAKWVNRITLLDHDEPGFWEVNGYHNHGNPWKEERYS